MTVALTIPFPYPLEGERTDGEAGNRSNLMTYLAQWLLEEDRTEIDLLGAIDWTDCALESLKQIYEECSEENWDGYGGTPISLEAYLEASRLLRIIPNSFPMPDVLPEPDGGIGLEWYKDKGFSFVASLGGKTTITYVGRFGRNNQTYGTETFTDSVPSVILNGLKRLFPKQ